MSAKADRIRDQFVQQTGALDAITKPFDPQALVAVVENALRRVNTAHASSARLPDFDAEETTAVERESQPATKRSPLVGIVAQKLGEIAALVAHEKPTASVQEMTAALVERLTAAALYETIEVVRDLDRATAGSAILAGDLGALPIG